MKKRKHNPLDEEMRRAQHSEDWNEVLRIARLADLPATALLARIQLGELTRQDVERAAHLGHPAAQLATGEAIRSERERQQIVEEILRPINLAEVVRNLSQGISRSTLSLQQQRSWILDVISHAIFRRTQSGMPPPQELLTTAFHLATFSKGDQELMEAQRRAQSIGEAFDNQRVAHAQGFTLQVLLLCQRQAANGVAWISDLSRSHPLPASEQDEDWLRERLTETNWQHQRFAEYLLEDERDPVRPARYPGIPERLMSIIESMWPEP